jgi:hypothetical protein
MSYGREEKLIFNVSGSTINTSIQTEHSSQNIVI